MHRLNLLLHQDANTHQLISRKALTLHEACRRSLSGLSRCSVHPVEEERSCEVSMAGSSSAVRVSFSSRSAAVSFSC